MSSENRRTNHGWTRILTAGNEETGWKGMRAGDFLQKETKDTKKDEQGNFEPLMNANEQREKKNEPRMDTDAHGY
jgi:hypothetical protein